MRFRNIYMAIFVPLIILMWVATDPDQGLIQHLPIGASTIAMLLILSKSVIYVGLLHLSRRALLDYVDFRIVIQKAVETPAGAGHVAIAIALIMVAISIVQFAAVSN